MNAQTRIEPPGLAKLREPFLPHQISKKPQETRAQIEERKARKQGCMVWKCPKCGNAHHKDAIHLDYVGHAAVTDRLLDTDPQWTWEPVSYGQDGLPAFDRNGGLWIKLTVLGVTRLGYGDADGKTGGNAVKEIIGDAIRNAGMRFGMALDLWHKGDLHVDEQDDAGEKPQEQQRTPRQMTDDQWSRIVKLAETTGVTSGELAKEIRVKNVKDFNFDQAAKAIDFLNTRLAEKAKAESNKSGATQEFADSDIPY